MRTFDELEDYELDSLEKELFYDLLVEGHEWELDQVLDIVTKEEIKEHEMEEKEHEKMVQGWCKQ